jgi:hypothetical protein
VVECFLAKEDVAGSTPVSRSNGFFCVATPRNKPLPCSLPDISELAHCFCERITPLRSQAFQRLTLYFRVRMSAREPSAYGSGSNDARIPLRSHGASALIVYQ